MDRDEFLNKIDQYILSQKNGTEQGSFRELIKQDIEKWADFETKRAVAINIKNNEELALKNRFRKDYSPSEGGKEIKMFSDAQDDTLITMMKAAFVDSNNPNDLSQLRDVLSNKDMDWEMIMEFLKGESED